MKRIHLATLAAVLLAPLSATFAGEAQGEAAWSDGVQPISTVAADAPVRRVAFLDRVFASFPGNCACRPSCVSRPACTTRGGTTPGCTTRGCTTPGCATRSYPCKSRCPSGLIPVLMRQASCLRCTWRNCSGCATCAPSAGASSVCATGGCAPRLAALRQVGYFGDYDTGSCNSPNICGDTSCHNYWHNYCNERQLTAVIIRSRIARRRAYRSGIGACAGIGCPISGASDRCSIPGCTSVPGGTPPKSPFLDDPKSPPLPPILQDASMHGPTPIYGPGNMPQSPAGITPYTGVMRGGLHPAPGYVPPQPPKRLPMRSVRKITRAEYTEPVSADEASDEIAPAPQTSAPTVPSETGTSTGPAIKWRPKSKTENRPATEPRPTFESGSHSGAASLPNGATAMERTARVSPRVDYGFAIESTRVKVLANGAQMTFNPYVTSKPVAPSAPRRLLPVQQEGEQLKVRYPTTSAATFMPAKGVTPTSASAPVEGSRRTAVSKAAAPAEPLSPEIATLPAMIRFIRAED